MTFVVVMTLAVAIGANTAIFSVVESVLLQPLPNPPALSAGVRFGFVVVEEGLVSRSAARARFATALP